MSSLKNKQLRFQTKDLIIELDSKGNDTYTKVSFPVKYGLFSRIETDQHIFEFNLNHEIRHARSKSRKWPHPLEWLKRTMGNDWVYYSTGGYSGVVEALGEYYLPNLTYPANSLFGGTPFLEKEINQTISGWHRIITRLKKENIPDRFSSWIGNVRENTPEKLAEKADELFRISGSRVNVMPPDARHVDYQFIPLTICDGCLYKCRFCKVKNNKKFSSRSSRDINNQIQQLTRYFGRDIVNYNALFLGEHDALNAPGDLILDTVQTAWHAFDFESSYMKGNYLFLFASADSFLNAPDSFFQDLNRLPFRTYINIGLESCDKKTLELLGKPVPPGKVLHAFKRVQEINDVHINIEITCNFVMDDTLPSSHYENLIRLVRDSAQRTRPKGHIYLSPLKFDTPSREVLYDFYKIKSLSRFPTFLYLIQRL